MDKFLLIVEMTLLHGNELRKCLVVDLFLGGLMVWYGFDNRLPSFLVGFCWRAVLKVVSFSGYVFHGCTGT